MATWKDGAAYAPVERPDGFATPVVGPLSSGEPYRAQTPGPVGHPTGFDPLPPQQPLHLIGDRPSSVRDPRDAFTVYSSLMTADPGVPPAGPRNPLSPFPTTAQSALDTAPPPPTGQPLDPPGPATAYPPPTVPSVPTGPWAPPPSVALPPVVGTPVPVTESHRALARVASVLCFVGFLVSNTSAFMLLAAGVIGLRTKPLTKALGYVATSVGASGLLVQWYLAGQPSPMFTTLWGFIALGCSIGFMLSSLRGR
ncbi:hypothetical protein H5392_01490 [Tessaracoccus sp. MC1865]|uniref:hypothetical protein n=1 Tax=Tessaracoccus sp. MC1865 TaxID=2760310 RepID=UPI00160349E4|nr:hypothetical protein [Tessaracoccus sp. MC1865]MBB1482530.1 hypothetical protein [Tessaracoccus sp. MC1865]QTO38016.1 hypothetical protein J7D54_02600 [Tessaracoccus sp. MC1865]